MTRIIDFHCHVDDAPASDWNDPPERLVPLLDEAGIDVAVCMTYTDFPGLNPAALEDLAEACDRFSGRLVPFARLDPRYRSEAPAALDRAVTQLGYRGLKLHPTSTLAYPPDDPTVTLLRRCGELGIPALFHCGDDPHTTPQCLALAAQRAPDTAVVMGHMGGYLHVDEAIAAAERHDNLYLETSAMPYPSKIAEACERLGPHRVLFGSDGPGCNPALELHKVALADLDPEAETLVLGGNAAGLLALDA